MTENPGQYGMHPRKAHLGGYIVGGDPNTYAPGVWLKLLQVYQPTSMVDIGCGEGMAANWFMGRGLEVHGVDGCNPETTRLPWQRRLVHDYTEGPLGFRGSWDLGWACEFVEHVDEAHMVNILDTFKRCRVLAMTHAVPGQVGHHHVNCQPQEYWLEKLLSVGMVCNMPMSLNLRDETDAHWVKQTLLVFERELHEEK